MPATDTIHFDKPVYTTIDRIDHRIRKSIFDNKGDKDSVMSDLTLIFAARENETVLVAIENSQNVNSDQAYCILCAIMDDTDFVAGQYV